MSGRIIHEFDGHGGIRTRVIGNPKPEDVDPHDPAGRVRYGDPFSGYGYTTPEEVDELLRQEEAERAYRLERITIESNEGISYSVPANEALEAAKPEGQRLYAGKFKTEEELAEAYERLVAELKAQGIEVD